MYVNWHSEVVTVRKKNGVGYVVDLEPGETLSMVLQRVKELYTKEVIHELNHVIYPYGKNS